MSGGHFTVHRGSCGETQKRPLGAASRFVSSTQSRAIRNTLVPRSGVRGQPMIAQIAGYGSTSGCRRSTTSPQPRRDGSRAERAAF